MGNCNESGFTFSLLVVVAAAPGCHQQPDENWRLQTETTACQKKNNLQHIRLNKSYSPMWARSEIFNLSSHPCNPANNETNHPHHLPTDNIPCKSGIIATFVCRYLTMHWICANTHTCVYRDARAQRQRYLRLFEGSFQPPQTDLAGGLPLHYLQGKVFSIFISTRTGTSSFCIITILKKKKSGNTNEEVKGCFSEMTHSL